MAPEVQKDLGLSAKQEAQIKRLTASLDRQRREAFAEKGAEEIDPRARMSAMMALQRKAAATATKSLNKRQKDRLAEIELRREGTLAVARKEVASKLKLTTAQNKEVKAVVDEMRQAMARSMPRPPGEGPGRDDGGERPSRQGTPGDGADPEGPNLGEGTPAQPNEPALQGDEGASDAPATRPARRPNFDSPEFRAQMTKMRETHLKLRETATKKIDEILTTEQKAAFEKLLGKPFDLSKLGPPGGGPSGEDPPNRER